MQKEKITKLKLTSPITDLSAQYVRAKDMPQFLGISKSTFYRTLAEGKFPTGIKFTDKCVVWNLADIHTFMRGLSNES